LETLKDLFKEEFLENSRINCSFDRRQNYTKQRVSCW